MDDGSAPGAERPYIPPPLPGETFVPLKGRLIFLQIAFIIFVVITIVSFVTKLLALNFLNDVRSNYYNSEDEINAAAAPIESFATIIGLGILVMFVVCAVAYGRFIMCAARNLDTLGPNLRTVSTPWLVGWYFVPLANLLMPAIGVNEIVRDSRAATSRTNRRYAPLVLWWLSWVASNVTATISVFMGRDAFKADSFELFVGSVQFRALSDIFVVIAAILFIFIARAIHDEQSHIMARDDLKSFE